MRQIRSYLNFGPHPGAGRVAGFALSCWVAERMRVGLDNAHLPKETHQRCVGAAARASPKSLGGNDMRFGRAMDLLQLSFEMQGSAEGVSLGDIENQFKVSRRTAERMRDAVCLVFPQADEYDSGDRIKRWRIRTGARTLPVSAEDLAALTFAAERLRSDSRTDQAERLDRIGQGLRSHIAVNALRKTENDYELQIELEGSAWRAGPRPNIDRAVLEVLRDAIQRCQRVRLHYRYRTRGNGTIGDPVVDPYGLLYGNRHYLVAYKEKESRLFSLSNIEKVEVLEERFPRDPGFNLGDYAAHSFGVFQETPVEVVWRVSPEAAADAREFLFHPSQELEDQNDGSLLVRFTAGGLKEMCWHLFTWGETVQVQKPAKLRRQMWQELTRACKALGVTLEDKPETQAKLKHEVDELRARVADLERKLAPGKV